MSLCVSSLLLFFFFFFLMIRRPPRSTLFPYTNALPILEEDADGDEPEDRVRRREREQCIAQRPRAHSDHQHALQDRKSTRLNSSHSQISYAVFCLKKKKERY